MIPSWFLKVVNLDIERSFMQQALAKLLLYVTRYMRSLLSFRNTDMPRDKLPCNIIIVLKRYNQRAGGHQDLERTLLKGVNGLLEMNKSLPFDGGIDSGLG